MSPTVFRDGPFRFFFFSKEETRMHVHVSGPDGEVKFWLKPTIELVRSVGLSDQDVSRIRRVLDERRGEIIDAWHQHFGS
ncbi:MAG: DUF4160 domain-containing protein [Actinomycetota bacterium]